MNFPPHTLEVTNAPQEVTFWHPGRAPLDAIERGEALDIFISAAKFNDSSTLKNVRISEFVICLFL